MSTSAHGNRPIIEKRLRELRGRDILEAWSQRLAKASGFDPTPSDFLSLEETESLKDAFFARVKKSSEEEKEDWPSSCRNIVFEFLGQLPGKESEEKVVVFSNVDRLIGAILIPLGVVLEKAEEIWQVTDEDYSVTTRDVRSGLCVEFDRYDREGEYQADGWFHMTIWGDFAGKP